MAPPSCLSQAPERMLRKALYVVGFLLLALVVILAMSGVLMAFWWQLLVLGVILVLGLTFERWRYKPPSHAAPNPAWTDTGERFVDPASGQLTGVWFDPASGERHYLLVSDEVKR